MSGPPPGPPRRSDGRRSAEMSAQQDWLAAKKAEIEAKKRVGQAPPHPVPAPPVVAAAPPPVVATGSSLVPDTKPSVPSLPFSNDGSFLEQFKRLQEQQKSKANPAVKVEPVVAPPPPLKKVASTVKTEPVPGPSSQSSGPWFMSALERAKQIAQSFSHPVSPLETGPSSSSSVPVENKFERPLPQVADELASLVAVNGDHVEAMARERNLEERELLFLQDSQSELYQQYRSKVEALRSGMKDEKKRARKSRWGAQEEKVEEVKQESESLGKGAMNRSPHLVQYAMKVFGSADLEDHQWKQCEDQMKMSAIYQEMLKKQTQNEAMLQSGKRKYEYDSDEETEGGTWEHKARKLEMEKTSNKAEELTQAAKGRHHIGDFLPPDELKKFIAKYEAIQKGETFDESDYVENKIKDDNKGFKMLQKMGWNEGSGLGSTGQGITAPINQGNQSDDKKGLGVTRPDSLEEGDDEFDAYRKRMMLAYRFRPNPLNNPRRAYY
ncbi:SURP and G-patch domain-containing protein 1-like isoform X1 [Tigriopus californicus]|uniref:SURP and G-patch domain-containing protein 1-like isoform X1 n=1 Tax=Tigriopus californicus TaxID=6832 RepID=UPI0027DAA22C|nr:SURP and G-patch domain-containing protein 1-like isoform X1 [Tigriopus californicus]